MSDQAENLRKKLAGWDKQMSAKTICFVSGKGGVGKSNIALSFSIALQRQQKNVLLIDFDIGMGNIDVLLGTMAHKTIVDMFTDYLSIEDVVSKGPENLDYISGSNGLTSFFIMDTEKREHFFKEYNKLVSQYDFIIFDMGAGVTQDSMFFILAADESIVISTPEPTSITDGYGMIKHIVNKRFDMPIYIVMNRSETERQGLKALERFKTVSSKFLNKNIEAIGNLPFDPLVSKSVIRQIPFILLDKKSSVSKSLIEMSETYLSYSDEIPKKESFIQRLKVLIRKR